MKRMTSEKQVLKMLKIKDFRHLSKEKVMEFASMLPYIDPEIAKGIIAQFPEFANMSTQILKEYSATVDKALKEGAKGSEAFYKTCDKMIDSLQKKLDKENLSEKEMDHIIDKMIEIANMIEAKSEKDKNFILKIVKSFFSLALMFLAGALALLGIKTSFTGKK